MNAWPFAWPLQKRRLAVPAPPCPSEDWSLGVALGLVLSAAVFCVMPLSCAMGCACAANYSFAQKVERISPGMAEAAVLATLGTPPDQYSATPSWLRQEYGADMPLVTGKLLVYGGGFDLVAFVYLDPDGRVEQVIVRTND